MAENGKPLERIHFVEVEIQNHMRVRRAHVFLPGAGVVPVSGKNRNGKTSFKRSLAALVGGDAEVEEAPRHRGAPADEESYIVGRLSDGTTLRRSFTGAASSKKGRLTAKDSEDRLLSQAHLNAIVGPRAIRPMSFLEKKGPEQREILMGFAPGLAGELHRFNARKAQLEDERRPHNSQMQVLGRIRKPEGEKPTRIDVTAELQELGRLQGVQRDRGDVERDLREVEQSMGRNKDAQRSATVRIADLEEQLARARRDLEALEAAHENLGATRATIQEQLADLPSVDSEIDAVRNRLAQADAVNAKLEPWKEWERAQVAIDGHRTEIARLNGELAELEVQKRTALDGAHLPFTGLTFDDAGEILLDGSPLSAASGMELCRLALEVAIADNPKLGVVFMNGNELDADALQEIHRLAEQHDFQVIMDIIHSPGMPGEVRMADGVAHQAAPAEASAS